tara:strand:+ start:1537 stop:1707 length:171 start_codon:yes stop_codon:yes gene_type:complete
MKEFALIVIGAASALVAIESIHIYQHSNYCKTEMEWASEYGLDKDDLYRLRQELNN